MVVRCGYICTEWARAVFGVSGYMNNVRLVVASIQIPFNSQRRVQWRAWNHVLLLIILIQYIQIDKYVRSYQIVDLKVGSTYGEKKFQVCRCWYQALTYSYLSDWFETHTWFLYFISRPMDFIFINICSINHELAPIFWKSMFFTSLTYG